MRKAIKEGRLSGLAGLVIGRPKQTAIKCKDRGWLGPVWDLLETCLDWMLTVPYFWICPFLFLAWIRALLVWLDCCDSSFRLRRLYTVWLPNCFDGNFFYMLFLHGFRLTVAAVHDCCGFEDSTTAFFPPWLEFCIQPALTDYLDGVFSFQFKATAISHLFFRRLTPHTTASTVIFFYWFDYGVVGESRDLSATPTKRAPSLKV